MNLLKTLLETFQQKTTEELFELAANKIAFIAKKQQESILKAVAMDRSETAKKLLAGVKKPDLAEAEAVVAQLSKASEKHLQWVVNKYVQLGSDGHPPFMLEDVTDRVQDSIEQFEEERKKLKKKDLLQYKSFAELEDALTNEDYDDEPEGSEHVITPVEQSFIDKKEVEVVHRGDGVRVYVPKNYEAAKYFGRGTKWCTASKKSSTYFDQYSKTDPLYIVYAKGKKYQLHFKSGQFMDARDRPADISELFSAHPILYKLFETQAAKVGNLAMMRDDVDEKALNTAIEAFHKKGTFSSLIKELSSNKLKRVKAEITKWMSGEHIIAKGPKGSNAKSSNSSDVNQFFGRSHDSAAFKATHEKFCKVYTPEELLELVKPLYGKSVLNLLANLSEDFLKYIVGDKALGEQMQKDLYEELLSKDAHRSRDSDTITIMKKLADLGYGIPDDKVEQVVMAFLEGYDAEKNIKQLVDELHVKIEEPLQLKMVEKKASIIASFDAPSNKVKERARMFAKRDSEKGWRG